MEDHVEVPGRQEPTSELVGVGRIGSAIRRPFAAVARRVLRFLIDRQVVADIIDRRLAIGGRIDGLEGRLNARDGEVVALADGLGRLGTDTAGQVASLARDLAIVSESVQRRPDHSEAVRTLTAGLGAIQRSLTRTPTQGMGDPTSVRAETPEAALTEVPLDPIAAELVYSGLEDRFRGSSDIIRAQQSAYVKLIQTLPGSQPVADLGCGRGEFLSLLAEACIPSVGVDLNATFVAECREQGLEAHEQDLLGFLAEQTDHSLRAVVSFQVLEHLPFPVLLRTFAEAFRVLVPGGFFLSETPNGANLAVGGSTFWLDHTHVRPLHPALLQHLAEFYGFVDVRVDLVSVPSVPWRLEAGTVGDRLAEAILGLQEYVLSGQDALLVAYRPT